MRLPEPEGEALPAAGFASGGKECVAPADDPTRVQVQIAPGSERLALLEPFAPWEGQDFVDLLVLLRAAGKCTTDHISPAGPWLRFRGHLDRISDNMFLGANNAFAREAGKGINVLTGVEAGLAQIARSYKAAGQGWIAVGDENYGEGSSREHAAMSPRYLGCRAVVARSFARIHETNLKKQGILALTFCERKDYERIQASDRVSITGLAAFAPERPLTLRLRHEDGRGEDLAVTHSFTAEQIRWFQAGSVINTMRS